MRAVFITGHGDIEQLSVANLPQPEPARGEVVVQLHAAALNHLDIWVRKGRPGLALDFPHVLGSDGAGTIAAVGDGVSGWQAGDEVILNPGLSCGHCAACARGEQSMCDAFSIVGMGRPGTYAEAVAVPATNLYRKPKHLNWEQAAALPLAYVTAWRMLQSRAKVIAGETVLIHGIGGGVALAGLQFAHRMGARTIVTSSSDEKLDQARALGADETVRYDAPGLADSIRDLSDGAGVDVVIDTVGASTWPLNVEVARKGGRIVHCGVTTGAVADAQISAIYWKQLTIMGSTMGSHEDFRGMLAAVNAGRIEPVLDQRYSLDDAASAQARMEAGDQFGKIILHP